MSSKSRYESLDAIRGIAAAVVLLHHCLLVLPVWAAVVDSGRRESFLTTLFGFPPLSLIWAGDAAVKVFFVLSGFVLSLMFFDRTPVHYAAFAVKRLCRIYLPYLAVVFAGMLLMTALSTYPWPDLSFWVAGSWNGPVTWPLIVDHVLMLGQIKYNIVDNPIWSLVIEMRYSLAFPAIIWLISRTMWQVAFSASLLLSVASMLMISRFGRYWIFDLLQYAFLFVSGALLAKNRAAAAGWFRELPAGCRASMGCTSLLLLSTFCLIHVRLHALRVIAILTPHLGAVLLLLVVIGSYRVQRMLIAKPLLWLGQISYSLYLSHVVVLLTLISILHGRVRIEMILVLTPFVAIVVAWVLYHTLERPSMRLGRILAGRVDSRRTLAPRAVGAPAVAES